MKSANVLLLSIFLIANSATAATPLPDAELHRLASYLAYVVVGVEAEAPDGGSIYTVGANCNECNGSGELGDGTVVFPCEWSDGLYYCNKGKIAKKSDGDSMDVCEVGCALCESVCDCDCGCKGKCGGSCGCDNCNCATPERDELFDKLDNPPARFNESYVRELEYDLQKALQEAETLRGASDKCQPIAEEELPVAPEPEPEPKQAEVSSRTVTLYRMKGSRWNWEGRSNPSTQFMRDHLMDDHGIDASMMNREQMQILHDNAHTYGDDKAFGFPTEFNSSMTSNSCPSGNCPTSSSSSGGGCPGGNCPTSGSSRSRGFFGRWR